MHSIIKPRDTHNRRKKSANKKVQNCRTSPFGTTDTFPSVMGTLAHTHTHTQSGVDDSRSEAHKHFRT